MGTCIAVEPGLSIFKDAHTKYGGRRFLHMDENLTVEVNIVTFSMAALMVATAMNTSDPQIHLHIHAF
jgi:hypothetical protein